MTDREELEIAVKALDSKKAKNITALKVDDLTILANYFVIVHVFLEETRDFYQLERLWADGTPVDISGIVKD